MKYEIDYGASKPKDAMNSRFDDIEQAILKRRMEKASVERKAKRANTIRILFLAPLALVILVGATLGVLDYLHIINLFGAPPSVLITAQLKPPPAPALKAVVPIASPTPTPVQAPAIPPEEPTQPRIPINEKEIQIQSSRGERINHGINIINKELAVEETALGNGQTLLNSLNAQLASAQQSLAIAINQTNSYRNVQSINNQRDWQTSVNNLQISVSNQITNDNDSANHINSLQLRLEKAQSELVDCTAKFIAAGGGQDQQ